MNDHHAVILYFETIAAIESQEAEWSHTLF